MENKDKYLWLIILSFTGLILLNVLNNIWSFEPAIQNYSQIVGLILAFCGGWGIGGYLKLKKK